MDNYVLKKYLESLQKGESIFPMDSLHKKKKSKVIRTAYPNEQQSKYKAETNERIMIDVDETIHVYEKGWDNGKLGDVIEGSKEALKWFRDQGFKIGIYTTRLAGENTDTERLERELLDWLKLKGFEFDFVTGKKLGARFYIDNKAVHFKGNWVDTLNEVKERMGEGG